MQRAFVGMLAAGVHAMTKDEIDAYIASGTAECYQDFGKTYRGQKSTTRMGVTCQRWDDQAVHTSELYTPERYPDGGLEENYCRNPTGKYGWRTNDGDPQPWCFTTDPNQRWDFCGVPKCTLWWQDFLKDEDTCKSHLVFGNQQSQTGYGLAYDSCQCEDEEYLSCHNDIMIDMAFVPARSIRVGLTVNVTAEAAKLQPCQYYCNTPATFAINISDFQKNLQDKQLVELKWDLNDVDACSAVDTNVNTCPPGDMRLLFSPLTIPQVKCAAKHSQCVCVGTGPESLRSYAAALPWVQTEDEIQAGCNREFHECRVGCEGKRPFQGDGSFGGAQAPFTFCMLECIATNTVMRADCIAYQKADTPGLSDVWAEKRCYARNLLCYHEGNAHADCNAKSIWTADQARCKLQARNFQKNAAYGVPSNLCTCEDEEYLACYNDVPYALTESLSVVDEQACIEFDSVKYPCPRPQKEFLFPRITVPQMQCAQMHSKCQCLWNGLPTEASRFPWVQTKQEVLDGCNQEFLTCKSTCAAARPFDGTGSLDGANLPHDLTGRLNDASLPYDVCVLDCISSNTIMRADCIAWQKGLDPGLSHGDAEARCDRDNLYCYQSNCPAAKMANVRNDDSCSYANDGVCSTEICGIGKDCTDCNDCPYVEYNTACVAQCNAESDTDSHVHAVQPFSIQDHDYAPQNELYLYNEIKKQTVMNEEICHNLGGLSPNWGLSSCFCEPNSDFNTCANADFQTALGSTYDQALASDLYIQSINGDYSKSSVFYTITNNCIMNFGSCMCPDILLSIQPLQFLTRQHAEEICDENVFQCLMACNDYPKESDYYSLLMCNLACVDSIPRVNELCLEHPTLVGQTYAEAVCNNFTMDALSCVKLNSPFSNCRVAQATRQLTSMLLPFGAMNDVSQMSLNPFLETILSQSGFD